MKWTKAENIVCEELNGGALLVNVSNGARWSLNAMAAALWRLCDGRMGAPEIAHALQQRTDVIAAFCEQFRTHGLLLPVNMPESAAYSFISMSSRQAGPIIKPLGLGTGPRRRPSPRGVSGPG